MKLISIMMAVGLTASSIAFATSSFTSTGAALGMADIISKF